MVGYFFIVYLLYQFKTNNIMKTLQTITARYEANEIEIESLKNKIILKERQIYRLQNRIEKRQNDSHWTTNLIIPVMDLVRNRFPQLTWNTDRLIPMGLRCSVSVFGYEEGKDTCSVALTFTPRNADKSFIAFDNGKKGIGYPNGTLGSLNGFDNIETPLTDIELLFGYIQYQLDKK